MTLGIIFAFIQTVAWAGASVVLQRLSSRLDSWLVNAVRGVFGFLLIAPCALLVAGPADWQALTGPNLIYLIGSALIGAVVGDALYVQSLDRIGVNRATPIASSSPVFTVLFSLVLLDEEITLPMVLGMALVLLGICIIARPDKAVASTLVSLPRRQLVAGVAMAVGTSLLWGLSGVVLSMGLKVVNPLVANLVRVPAVCLASFLVAAARGRLGDLKRIDRHSLKLLAAGGVLGWGLAGTFWVAAIQLAGPSRAAIISATAPLFAVPLGMLFCQERPTRLTSLGTFLTIAGVVLVV